MSITLSELDDWDPDAIHTVFEAATQRSEMADLTADSLQRIIDSVPWKGKAYEAARQTNADIVRDLRLEAEEVQAVARATAIAENEIRAVKREWDRICRLADRWGVTIDAATNSIIPPSIIPANEDERAEIERRMDILEQKLTELLVRANDADRDLAAGIRGATGRASADDLNREVTYEEKERQELSELFARVFGKPPVTDQDWAKASWLDPRNLDAALDGMDSSVLVAQISPVPGQGTVRGSLFIMEEKVLDPFAPGGYDPTKFTSLFDYGNHRDFSSSFDPRNAKGAFLIDYESGVVIFRQNPTHDTSGNVSIGSPDVVVSQAADGTVRLDYRLPNPSAMVGPVNMAEAAGKPVAGTLFIVPTQAGPTASGVIGDYPSIEIYADPPGGGVPRTVLLDEQDNRTIFGPLLELGSYHRVGDFPDEAIQRELDYPPAPRGGTGRLRVPTSTPIPTLGPNGVRLVDP